MDEEEIGLEQKTKKKKWPWIVGAIIVVIVIGSAMGGGKSGNSAVSSVPAVSSNPAAQSGTSSEVAAAASTVSTASAAPSNPVAVKKAYSATLLSGYYEIGVDIPAGTYDFAIVSGSGNVMTTSGEVNLIMGKQSDDMYQKTYKNAELNSGDTLFIQQCSIKISSQETDASLQKRINSSAKGISLSSGKYTAGKDFQPGYYDITLISGSGNVMCDDNELNAIFSNDNTFGVKEYKNVPFESGYKLDIEGPKVKLTPSK